MKQLPLLIENPNYDFRCTLGEYIYLFDIEWDDTMQAYYLDTTNLTDGIVMLGQRIVGGVNLFSPLGRRYGALYLKGPLDYDPTFESLGDNHQLVWLSQDEVRSL